MPTYPSIVFRADGNAQIGLGHVMRCLALADMLGSEFACRFVVYQPATALTALFGEKQIPLLALQTGDVTEFSAQLSPNDIVVLDGYAFDELFQRAVRSVCERLVFIDDLLNGHQVADVLINHTANISETDYDAESYTRFLLGPQYALVNPRFRASDPIPSARSILVNLGGADPMNVSYQIVHGLMTHFSDRPLRVVLGAANPHGASFAGLPPDQVTVLRGLSAADMTHEIERCQLAIVSCSTVSYEVATIGRPFIGILTANNQTRLASFLENEGLAIGVLPLPLAIDRFLSLLNQATPNQGVTQQRLYLDGKASQRFRAIFRGLAVD